MAAEIKKEFGVEPRLIRGSGGTFIVTADNQQVFSKLEQGRFPTEKEIIDKLRALSK